MKMSIKLSLTVIVTLLIVGCGSTSLSETPMSNTTSVAALSYISSGFIESEVALNEDPEAFFPIYLSNAHFTPPGTTTTKVEGEIGYVNIYLDKLKVFMDDGFDSISIDDDVASDNPEYDFMFSYSVEGELFKIYYNFNEETGVSEGILIANDVTYDLEIEDNLTESESLDTKRNIILNAVNGDNSITIDFEIKTDEDGSKEYLEVTKNIEGIESIVTIEIKDNEDTFKVSITDGDNSYDFKVETTDEVSHYKLNYIVDGVIGTAKITESVNEDGDLVYDYKITEGDITQDIKKDPPGQNKD